ncbi:MAG: phage tail protein, partial [Comamonas sp.]|nr:phage tail protein [Comamonas sp.]
LSGVLLPEITGGEEYLELLRAMADTGKAWVLVDGNGELLGLWTIEKLDRTRTLFFQDGTARRIEFTLALARVDDDDVDQLGDLELEEELHIDP